MRILHVLGKLDRGGVETWLVQVLRHIDRQKYQMDFLVHTTEPGAYDDEVRSLGSRIIPCLRPSNPAMYARNFRRVLRKYGPYDVVHSHVHHYSGYVLMLAKMWGVPVRIAHSHTSAPEASSGFARKAYLSLMRTLIRRSASLGMSFSGVAADSLMPTWRQDNRWHLCRCGVEASRFTDDVDRDLVRQEMGISPVAKVVAHVGRFSPVKNHTMIVQVAEELKRLDSRTVFLLVGDGPTRPEIETLIRSRGLSDCFVLAGFRDDIPRLLKGAADAFIFPSLYEGLGIALMEAQLSGLKCVASDVIPREVALASDMVTWMPLNASVKSWAAALSKAIAVRETRNVPAGLREMYSIDESVSHIAALYEHGLEAGTVQE
jgi:glycosyltransferase involved in cell wall biosynthesis